MDKTELRIMFMLNNSSVEVDIVVKDRIMAGPQDAVLGESGGDRPSQIAYSNVILHCTLQSALPP